MTAPRGICETVLYAEDLDAAERFYADVIGLRRLTRDTERGMSFRVNASAVLLVFNPRLTVLPHERVPSHGATGAGHIAFAVETLAAWPDRLTEASIEIEKTVDWPTGARSIYVRDPAGNSVELVEGEIWPK